MGSACENLTPNKRAVLISGQTKTKNTAKKQRIQYTQNAAHAHAKKSCACFGAENETNAANNSASKTSKTPQDKHSEESRTQDRRSQHQICTKHSELQRRLKMRHMPQTQGRIAHTRHGPTTRHALNIANNRGAQKRGTYLEVDEQGLQEVWPLHQVHGPRVHHRCCQVERPCDLSLQRGLKREDNSPPVHPFLPCGRGEKKPTRGNHSSVRFRCASLSCIFAQLYKTPLRIKRKGANQALSPHINEML